MSAERTHTVEQLQCSVVVKSNRELLCWSHQRCSIRTVVARGKINLCRRFRSRATKQFILLLLLHHPMLFWRSEKEYCYCKRWSPRDAIDVLYALALSNSVLFVFVCGGAHGFGEHWSCPYMCMGNHVEYLYARVLTVGLDLWRDVYIEDKLTCWKCPYTYINVFLRPQITVNTTKKRYPNQPALHYLFIRM